MDRRTNAFHKHQMHIKIELEHYMALSVTQYHIYKLLRSAPVIVAARTGFHVQEAQSTA